MKLCMGFYKPHSDNKTAVCEHTLKGDFGNVALDVFCDVRKFMI